MGRTTPWLNLRSSCIYLLLFLICGTIFMVLDYYEIINFSLEYKLDYRRKINNRQESLHPGFLLYTSTCHIPEMDPFDPTVIKYTKHTEGNPINCNKKKPPLVEANLTALIVLNESFDAYSIKENDRFYCCYNAFRRSDPKSDRESDDEKILKQYECLNFKNNVQIEDEFVKVKCFYNNTEIYRDFFSFVPPKFGLFLEKNSERENKPLNLLMAGLDGVSRVNLHRQMPKTVKFLKNDLKAVEFFGYNKVGDNTFPNLIPVLTGLSEDQLEKVCWINRTGHFDNCPFIWNKFKKRGFATSYAEDSAWMGIFNYNRIGFKKQPTDYYWRTFNFVANEEIGNCHSMNTNLCLGSRPEYKTLLDYTLKFVKSMKVYRKPFFNFFWSSSLSHDYFNYPRFGDDEFLLFFKQLLESGTLNNTVLIFLSDHGMRWGNIRTTSQGMLEERLPFVFVILPEWYKQKFPHQISNLQSNAKSRLTTPFDLHNTLLDLVEPYNLNSILSKNIRMRSQQKLSNNYSFFDNIPENRTCESAFISDHWCACGKSVEIEINSTGVKEAVEFTIKFLNDKLSHYKQCEHLSLKSISNARVIYLGKLKDLDEGVKRDLIVRFSTVPGDGIFEATIRQTFFKNVSSTLKVTGTVSRLNLYGSQSYCVSDFHIKLYCYCKI